MDEQDLALQPEVETEDPVNPPTDEQAEEETQDEKPQDEKSPEGAEETPEEAADEVQLVVDGEEPPPAREKAPGWVKELREQHRALKAQNAELKRKLQATGAEDASPLDPGPKPTLDGCDYDPARFEAELETWHDRKQQADRRKAELNAVEEKRRQHWNERLTTYAKQREELSKQIPTFGEAEQVVQSLLDVTQQGVIVAAADNPAMVICALGQNPKLAQDLASERDPVKFAVKMAKLEVRLKMAKKSGAPAPEKPVKGAGSGSGSGDAQLEKLRAEAERSGDYSKVVAYKQKLRQAQER